MLLLTWHGTILRVEQSQNRLIHAPLTPVRAVARDLAFTDRLPGGLKLHPGPHPGTVHVSRNGKTLRATPGMPFPSFDTAPPTPVLAVTEAEIAALRALLTTPHRHTDTGQDVPPARLEPGFMLSVGDQWRFNLAEARPTATADGIALPANGGILVASQTAAADAEIVLQPGKPPPAVSGPAAFQAAASASLPVRGRIEYSFLPLTASLATRDWFYTAAAPPTPGRLTRTNFVRRAAEVFLLTIAGSTSIFSRQGILHAAPPADAQPPYPAGLAREADIFHVAETALADAPRLPGTHAFLARPETSLLLETLLPLILMAPHLQAETSLIIPGPVPRGLAEYLALFSLDHLSVATTPGPLCCIDTLVWPDAVAPGHLAADILHDARARAAPNLPRATRRRLFLTGGITGGIANVARLAAIAATFGFEPLGELPPEPKARAAVFAASRAIIAVQGAALENLVFCAPGTQVLELTDNKTWRPTYAALSDKLSLVHAVLPSEAGTQGLSPEPAAFSRLLRILQARP
jgi:hypothetical protein